MFMQTWWYFNSIFASFSPFSVYFNIYLAINVLYICMAMADLATFYTILKHFIFCDRINIYPQDQINHELLLTLETKKKLEPVLKYIISILLWNWRFFQVNYSIS